MFTAHLKLHRQCHIRTLPVVAVCHEQDDGGDAESCLRPVRQRPRIEKSKRSAFNSSGRCESFMRMNKAIARITRGSGRIRHFPFNGPARTMADTVFRQTTSCTWDSFAPCAGWLVVLLLQMFCLRRTRLAIQLQPTSAIAQAAEAAASSTCRI